MVTAGDSELGGCVPRLTPDVSRSLLSPLICWFQDFLEGEFLAKAEVWKALFWYTPKINKQRELIALESRHDWMARGTTTRTQIACGNSHNYGMCINPRYMNSAKGTFWKAYKGEIFRYVWIPRRRDLHSVHFDSIQKLFVRLKKKRREKILWHTLHKLHEISIKIYCILALPSTHTHK